MSYVNSDRLVFWVTRDGKKRAMTPSLSNSTTSESFVSAASITGRKANRKIVNVKSQIRRIY